MPPDVKMAEDRWAERDLAGSNCIIIQPKNPNFSIAEHIPVHEPKLTKQYGWDLVTANEWFQM
ncbi:hypothetical protein HPP92_017884 [Vanilla planifolia]|uniref:Uncharacterized protein n=1 Tax=Vanilla planifolia TaxID=51239 RepID=A0A835QD13_VANPL|nr:hypothetical protein HPP92_017884 [Vanilla planifolia]